MNNLNFKLTDFSGPLDLLLSLIDDRELDISEIALGEVTEQFLAYLELMEDKDADELSEFLVVASKLILAKAQLLIPQFAPEEAIEGPALEDQLRLYRLFVEASREVDRLWVDKHKSFFRVEQVRIVDGFVWPTNVDIVSLEDSMQRIIHRLKPRNPLPETTIDRAISIKERIHRIRTLLMEGTNFTFRELLSDADNKTDIIVSFLAILELMKNLKLTVSQDTNFSDISIQNIP
jgi:segregation and condensation protein A